MIEVEQYRLGHVDVQENEVCWEKAGFHDETGTELMNVQVD